MALALALIATPAWGIPPRELADRARVAESHHDPMTAIRSLEELLAAGVDSSDVLYDLGTVRAEAGRLGEAVWCFEECARRSPFAFDAQRSLRAVRVRLARRDAGRTGTAVVETQPSLSVQIGELLPYDLSVPLGVVAECVVLLGLWLRRRAEHELSRVGATVAVILGAAVALFALGVVAARRESPTPAVVLLDGQRLLQAPRIDAIPDVSVREGERVDILGREGGYTRVRSLSGHQGWLPTRDVGVLTE